MNPDPPIWRRIAQELAAGIGPGGLGPGQRLPSEAQMAVRFGVNRHTVRRAVELLQRQGMVRVEQGRGAFVADDVIAYPVQVRTRFSEWVRRHNREPSGHILFVREEAAGPTVAAGLAVAEGADVVVMERLGLADGTPVSLGTHTFPAERLPGIAVALRTGGGVSAALAAAGVPDYVRLSTRVSARMPTATEADLLQIDPARPLLVTENVNVDTAGTIVEFGLARYPSSRVEIVFEP